MTGPDFIIIGAMKCGTTTLAAQLDAQPGLFVTSPKEPNFFSDDAVFSRGPDWYRALFEPARPGDLCGEASTHYTKRPDYPEALPRMRQALPEVRLVYMIRNPVERLISHYIHAWSEGDMSGPLTNDLIERHPALVDYGRYGWQIEPYIEAYGREAVLLTSLERLNANPDEELTRIVRHIGFERAVAWDPEFAFENVSSERVRKLPFHKLLIDSLVATTLRRRLIPKGLRQYVRDMRRMKTRPVLPHDVAQSLEARFLADLERLAAVFPDDPSLALSYDFRAPSS